MPEEETVFDVYHGIPWDFTVRILDANEMALEQYAIDEARPEQWGSYVRWAQKWMGVTYLITERCFRGHLLDEEGFCQCSERERTAEERDYEQEQTWLYEHKFRL